MKKLFVCATAMLLSLSMVACDDETVANTTEEIETTIDEIVEVEETQEEIVEVEEDIQEPEEEVVEEIDTFDYEELNYYLTTTLTDDEYKTYFEEIEWVNGTSTLREIEFDAHIMFVNQSEKYSTRCELMLASGDYDNSNFTGPYIKTRDIAYTQIRGLQEGSNVRVKATIENYDMDYGYLKINIKEISAR